MEARVAVLASGEGTNLQVLLDDPAVSGSIALVVSDREDAPALERARRSGVKAEFVDPTSHPDRGSYGRALLKLLEEESVGYVVLAGFMRILSPELVEAYRLRMLNVHPGLLPAFPGTDAVRDALEWGARVTGVTVHFVDEEMDHGPIVFQGSTPVSPDDTWISLEARIHELEHRLLPLAVKALINGRIEVDGRRVRVRD